MKLNNKNKQFIFDQMCEGLNISEIHRKFPDKIPAPNSIYRASTREPNFAAILDQGYTVWLYRKIDDLRKLAGVTSVQGIDDWRQGEALLKRQIDECKFILGKMAPILASRFNYERKI
jgi:hypothetical protein